MRVKLFANLAEEAGGREVELDLAGGATVADVLERLFEQHPSLREHIVDDEGVPAEHINFLVNGTAIDGGADALEYTLDEDDELAVFPPVTGGRSGWRPAAGERDR